MCSTHWLRLPRVADQRVAAVPVPHFAADLPASRPSIAVREPVREALRLPERSRVRAGKQFVVRIVATKARSRTREPCPLCLRMYTIVVLKSSLNLRSYFPGVSREDPWNNNTEGSFLAQGGRRRRRSINRAVSIDAITKAKIISVICVIGFWIVSRVKAE